VSRNDDRWFDHEKLDVYRESLVFVGWLSALLDAVVRAGDVKRSPWSGRRLRRPQHRGGQRKVCAKVSMPVLRYRARLCTWMCGRPRHSGCKTKARRWADSTRQRTPAANRPHADGTD